MIQGKLLVINVRSGLRSSEPDVPLPSQEGKTSKLYGFLPGSQSHTLALTALSISTSLDREGDRGKEREREKERERVRARERERERGKPGEVAG